jgi:nitric oxide dioxygenase
MTPREKQLVRESFVSIRELAGPVSGLFYGRLFELQPELRQMFHEDIGRQGLKLMDMLTAVVENMDRMEALNPVLQALGKRHAGYGVLPRHYDTVGQALLWAFGHALDGEFDEEQKGAWRVVIGKVSSAMKEGAASRPLGSAGAELCAP